MSDRIPLFASGQRVCLRREFTPTARVWLATIVGPHIEKRIPGCGQYWHPNHGGEWIVQIDGHEGQTVASDSEMLWAVTPTAEGMKA